MYYSKDHPLLYFPGKAGKSLHWYCGDDKENYKEHNKEGWHYHNTADKLEYNFNSLGYRTKELTGLNHDYILVFGCSYTEGVGLYEEEIWCNKIAQMYGLDVINLAKAGTGPDIIALNTHLFVKNKIVLPKCVLIQWPQSSRKSFAYIEKTLFHGSQIRLEDRNINFTSDGTEEKYEMMDSNWYHKRWAHEQGQMNYENLYHLNSVNNIWNALGVPVHNWTFQSDFKTKYDKDMVQTVKTKMTGRARDMAHDGYDIHDQVVEQIKDNVKCMI